jgi:hypothetical protein
MPFTTSIDPDYIGPSLRDLLPILGELSYPIEVRWGGSAEDHRLYLQHQQHTFVLIAPSIDVAEKAIWTHGGTIDVAKDDLEAAKAALTKRVSGTWRSTAEGLGAARATLLLTKVVGDALRAGKHPYTSASATLNCLFDRVDPRDVDVLIRLRAAKR